MDDINRQIQMIIGILIDDSSDPPQVKEALQLKQIHTARVAENCRQLAEASGCTPTQIRLALRIGWCHDLGRFLQFRRYHTFDDSKSVDHGLLSLKLVRALRLARDLQPVEKGLLWSAVALHNRRILPEGLPELTVFFASLLRDADRLDIYRIFIDYYSKGPVTESPLELYYPDTGIVTPAVAQAILQGISPPYELGRSVQDMRLIKLSWAFTLKTAAAVEMFRTCGIMQATRAVLPDTVEVAQVLSTIEAWAADQIKK